MSPSRANHPRQELRRGRLACLACLALGLSLSAGACGKAADHAEQRSGPPPTAEGQATTAAAPQVEAAPPAASQPRPQPGAAAAAMVVHERAVQALIERWLAAQNRGDFDAYAMLYASRFEGTKRTGAQTRAYGRVGWLADRKRMFGKAMAVTVSAPTVAIVGPTALVQFEQTWQSGGYRDVGPKQLLLVAEGTELCIAREEMLASRLESATAAAAAQDVGLDPTVLAPAVLAGGHIWLLLQHGDGGLRASGAPELVSAAETAVATDAIEGALPAQLQAWADREVELFAAGGRRCRGQVARVELLARVAPHFSSVQHWKGAEGATPPPRDEVRDEVWSLGKAGLAVAARVVPVDADACRGALVGRVAEADRPGPAPLQEARVEPELVTAALMRARQSPSWKATALEFAAQVAEPRAEAWDAYEGAAPTIAAYAAENGERLLYVGLRAGNGCGDFYGEHVAVFAVRGQGSGAKLRLLSDDRAPGRLLTPRLAMDVDADGKVELIGDDGIWRAVGPTWRVGPSWELPNLDCGC